MTSVSSPQRSSAWELANPNSGVPNIYFSYTMQCGNDSMKGEADGGGFREVPDGGSTLLLLGSGLSALFGLKRRTRKG